jgi:hypothetical protein
MIRARVKQGRIEAEDPIPAEWEGRTVQILALAPDDDPEVEVEKRLAALHALGPMEYEPGERDAIAKALEMLNDSGKSAMQAIAGVGR